MSLRQYLIVLALGTAMSLSSWSIVMIAIDPLTAGHLAFFVFYLTLGAGVAGIATIIGTLIRVMYRPDALIDHIVARSLRQGVLLSVLFIACLVLLANGLFSLGTMLLFIGIVVGIELVFFTVSGEYRA